MDFIQIRRGLSINKEEIEALAQVGERQIIIKMCSGQEYEVNITFPELMDLINKEENEERNIRRLTTQYFGK